MIISGNGKNLKDWRIYMVKILKNNLKLQYYIWLIILRL